MSQVPGLDAQIAALETAFTELVKALGRDQKLQVSQLARALENAARAPATDAPKAVALGELARRLR